MGTTRLGGGSLRTLKLRTLKRRAIKTFAVLATAGTLATASLVAAPVSAYATSYPSWHDVLVAKRHASTARAEVAKIKGIVKALDAKVKKTQAAAEAAGAAYGPAQDAYYDAVVKEQSLESQVKAAQKKADQSEAEAGQLAAQLARSGATGGFQLNLFLHGNNAGDLLDSIGDASKVSARANAIYKQAIQDRNTASALTDQAKVEKTILADLKAKAQAAYEKAQAAATAASDALTESQAHRTELEAQLKAFTTNAHKVEKGYQAYLKKHFGVSGAVGTFISSSGWARPTIGVITSGFGMRVNPVDGGYRLHNGTDIADGCGVAIYAAHGGTVTYAGPYGGLGNFIQIQDDGTYANGYGHIENGGIYVHIGEQVHVGQLIARTGATGEATGCHLHFMVIINGVPVDAVPFMRARGITLG